MWIHASVMLSAGILAAELPGTVVTALAIGQSPFVEVVEKPADRIDSADAVQGIAMNANRVFTVANRSISEYDKFSGKLVSTWSSIQTELSVVHLDSGVIHAGRLYAAHSNWPRVPMESSVEVFDIDPLMHVASFSFGTSRGSFTWLDWHAGFWWGTFTDYDIRQSESWSQPALPSAEISGTHIVKMDDAFRIVRSWSLPALLRLQLAPMNNSGGSWGPDGHLYLTGHDRAELYVVRLPPNEDVAEWVATLAAPAIQGQGIAWDRFALNPVLYGINRRHRQAVRLPLKNCEIDRQLQYACD
jgi:hypothetical protein